MKHWLAGLRTKSSWMTRVWLIFIIGFVVLGLCTMSLISYANSYTGKVFPGVHIGEVPIGGMSEKEITRYLQDMNDRLITDGWEFSVSAPSGEESFTILPVYVSGSNSVELMTIDIEAEVAALLREGKQGNVFTRAFSALQHRISQPSVRLSHISADEERIMESLNIRLAPLKQHARPARLAVTSIDPFSYEVVSSSPGVTFDTSEVIAALTASWEELQTPQIHIKAKVDEPSAVEEEFLPIVHRLETVLGHGDLLLSFTEPITSRERVWHITQQNMVDWLTVTQDSEHGAAFSLQIASTTAFIEEQVAPVVNVKPRNAKFEVSDSGRVTMFQASRPGVQIAMEETVAALNNAFMQRTWFDEGITKNVKVVTEQAQPEFATGEVNDLGITEVLGVGLSKFVGSPEKRKHNINVGAEKLNGVLIPPGAEFSTIANTEPYTLESGYVPELVIKGDEVKPEIGGGLCQIGSTLFRMAMNSGMPITQRRNHSLVVGYYNDLSNGLPGTDATIYDPNPDFRFLNDTGHYVLIQTDIDWTNSELRFILWGTNDGRKGSYTPPTVSRWIPSGEPKIIETEKLAPGVKECQHAYTGADASFTYIRTLSTGERVERIFESHYRPLPQICLVGKAPSAEGKVAPSETGESMIDLLKEAAQNEGTEIVPVNPLDTVDE